MNLRIVGIGLNALGALILAWRVKGILDTLVAAQHVNDANFQLLMDIINGRAHKRPLVLGMDRQVERRQRWGIYLLVLGFVLIAVGNAVVASSLYMAQP